MEAAGLLVGIISLVATCSQGYDAILAFGTFPKDSEVLYWQLKTQESRLEIWSILFGLKKLPIEASGPNVLGEKPGSSALSSLNHSPNIVKTVHGILSSMQEILLDSKRLTDRYGLSYSDVAFQATPSVYEPEGSRTSATGDAASSPSIKRAHTFSFGRVRWVVRDKRSFERLIYDLRILNEGLEATLPFSNQHVANFMLASQMVSTAGNATDLQRLQDASGDLPQVQAISAFKALNISSENDDSRRSGFGAEEIPFTHLIFGEGQDVQGTSLCLATLMSSHESQQVLVEWKFLGDVARSDDSFRATYKRVQDLVFLLHRAQKLPDLPCLDSLGFTVDRFRSRIGLILSAPRAIEGNEEMSWPISMIGSLGALVMLWTSLHEMIHLRPKLPILGHRIALAVTLVKCLIELHSTSWFHKSFRSSNVLFFNSVESGGVEPPRFPNITQPWIVGFGLARPNSKAEFSDVVMPEHGADMMYMHPDYLQSEAMGHMQPPTVTKLDRQRFEADYDMYSLGCVLLEIGLWRRLCDIWKPEYERQGYFRWSHRLRDKWAVELGGRCGATYQSIVEDLLSRGFDSHDSVRRAPMTNLQLVAALETLTI